MTTIPEEELEFRFFRAGGPADAADVFQNVPQVLGVKRHHFRLLGQSRCDLGNLPRRDGSNLTDRLG